MLEQKAREVYGEWDEMMNNMMKMFSYEDLLGADDESIIMMKKAFNLMSKAKDLAIEQAKAMDDINTKLDKLLVLSTK